MLIAVISDLEQGIKTIYGYDAANRRIIKHNENSTEHYFYDGLEVRKEKRISKDSKTEISRYSRAKNRLLAKMISIQPGKQKQKQKFYYHHDGLGSIIDLTGKLLFPESELYHFHFIKYDQGTCINPGLISILDGINLPGIFMITRLIFLMLLN